MLKFRRQILQAGVGLALVGPLGVQRTALAQTPACDENPTPRQIEGPFYTPQTPQRSKLGEGLDGEIVVLSGRVLGTNCTPLANAVVDIWSCDATGQYDNAGFKLRGHQITDSQGRFRFQTIKPGAYGDSRFRRTPHIHVKVQAPGSPLLTTQLYFPNEALNQQDAFFNPALLVQLNLNQQGAQIASFDFVLPARSES